MSTTTGIEWTDATWNPIRGCSRVSEGCRNCYAEKVAGRFRGPGLPYEGLTAIVNGSAKWNGSIQFVEERLLDPLKWRKGRRIFVNSMSDLFHENVTDEMLDRIFAVMALCPQHTFQVLTKRPERMLAYLTEPSRTNRVWMEFPWVPPSGINLGVPAPLWPLPNVWLGVSVENQKAADERIPLLLQTPAAVRFISAEPLLGAVDIYLYINGDFVAGMSDEDCAHWPHMRESMQKARKTWMDRGFPLLDWVICGGERGPGARPMHPGWARGLRDQCVAAGVPFFFKQWGEWAPYASKFAGDRDETGKWDTAVNPGGGDTAEVAITSDGVATNYTCNLESGFWCVSRVGKKAAGHLLDGVEWHQFPAVRG